MDELELLKKDWKKKASYPKLSFDEIHKMIWKKSSSIVKWIFIISIIEFTLPNLLYFVPKVKEGMEVYKAMGLEPIMLTLTIIQWTVIIYFIFQFYKRYKEISVLDSAKNLMKNIIKTRRTVRNYVIFCLTMLVVTIVSIWVGIYLTDDISAFYDGVSLPEDFNPEKLRNIMLIAIAIAGTVLTVVMGVVYFLLYGLLLRKLHKNYKELKELNV